VISPKPITILISLYKGYGMGDAVQMSAVLRHVRKHRPLWTIDFQAEPGRHCVGRGIAHNTFAYKEPYPHDYYDAEVQLTLYETFPGFDDRPNTRVATCLREHFGMDWDAECGRYSVAVSESVALAIDGMMSPMIRSECRKINRRGSRSRTETARIRKPAVAIHYQGDTAKPAKDLTHEQARAICCIVEGFGQVPVLVDWRNQSPLAREFFSTGRYEATRKWGGDAEYNTALIAQCEAFVGIDSGPAKCASATDTPSLVVWTGHHPIMFHDPAPNTTHLIRWDHNAAPPVCGNKCVVDWFEANYSVRHYRDDPVNEVREWLKETLT